MSSTQSRPVGLIGLGLMGSVLADRLTQAGLAVLGWDIRPERRRGAATLEQVFGECERVVLSLPDSSVAMQVLEGAAIRSGQTVIDTTTGDPQDALRMADLLRRHQACHIAATISGSSALLKEGKALTLVSGASLPVSACEDIWRAFGEEWLHVGSRADDAAKMKLVTNLVLGLNRAVLAEGLVLAGELGLDPAFALQVLRASPAASRIMEVKGGKMLAGDFTPQGRLSQHLKDVRLMLAASSKPLPLSEAHRGLLEKAESLGCGGLDNCAIIRAYE